jgi:hypothetical protein
VIVRPVNPLAKDSRLVAKDLQAEALACWNRAAKTAAEASTMMALSPRVGHDSARDLHLLSFMIWDECIEADEVKAAWERADSVVTRSMETRLKAQVIVAYSRDLREQSRNEARTIRDRLAHLAKRPRRPREPGLGVNHGAALAGPGAPGPSYPADSSEGDARAGQSAARSGPGQRRVAQKAPGAL